MKKRFIGGIIFLMLLSACSSDGLDERSKEQPYKLGQSDTELISLKSGIVIEKSGNNLLYQGDILLSEKQLLLLDEIGAMLPEMTDEEFIRLSKDDNGIPVYPFTGMSSYYEPNKTKAVGRSPYQNMFWSMLRYTFSTNLRPDQRRAISNAIAYIESVTNVRFYNATGKPIKDPQYGFLYPYVEFTASDRNNSAVGRIGGRQILNLESFDRATITHEICHALGLFHEQCRADRDNYVIVNYSNIVKKSQHNFTKETRNYYTLGGFDFSSIMLYASFDFAIDRSKPTMTKKDGTTFYENYTLSDLDRRFLNTFYLPYMAREDVCSELDKVVFDGNNRPLSEVERVDLERKLNQNRCSYPLRK